MQDLSSDSNEAILRKLRLRQGEIVKEINNDIAELREDLMLLVNDFTCVLSEKTEKDFADNSCRLSDVDLQVRRLNETVAVISSFSGIFQQFNSMTSKIFAVDTDTEHNSYTYEMETPGKVEKTTVSPVLKGQYDQAENNSSDGPLGGDFHHEIKNPRNSDCPPDINDRNNLAASFSPDEDRQSPRKGGKKRNLQDVSVSSAKNGTRRG